MRSSAAADRRPRCRRHSNTGCPPKLVSAVRKQQLGVWGASSRFREFRRRMESPSDDRRPAWALTVTRSSSLIPIPERHGSEVSGCTAIFVDQCTQHVDPLHSPGGDWLNHPQPETRTRRLQIQAAVWPERVQRQRAAVSSGDARLARKVPVVGGEDHRIRCSATDPRRARRWLHCRCEGCRDRCLAHVSSPGSPLGRLPRPHAPALRSPQLGADWEQQLAPNGAEPRSNALNCVQRRRRRCRSLQSRWSAACGPFVDTTALNFPQPR
jgi:hypothetical protein